MGGFAVEGNLKPPGSLHASDEADRDARALEHGSLLDMHLNEGRHGMANRLYLGFRQCLQCRCQFIAKCRPVGAAHILPPSHVARANKGHGSHAAGREAAPFLVGPRHNFDGSFRSDSGILKGFQYLEGGQRAKRTVELASRGLAVEMAADQDWRSRGIASFTSDEEVRYRILVDAESAGNG
ncbi:hypothetical protein thsrh120_55400 [Rhizobium sp. No.120]